MPAINNDFKIMVVDFFMKKELVKKITIRELFYHENILHSPAEWYEFIDKNTMIPR
jgi:hypothetical protein